MAVVTSGCADSSAEQAGGPKEAVKAVKTDAVRQESVRRTLEVVGTLAAEDQVTVSSEVDGVVRRVLADLGDRVASGQTLVETRSREAAIQPRPAARGARARAHEIRRLRFGPSAAQSRTRPTCGGPPPNWSRPGKASSGRPSCTSVNSSRSRCSMTRTRRCGSSAPPMTPRCRRRRTCRPTSTPRRRR